MLHLKVSLYNKVLFKFSVLSLVVMLAEKSIGNQRGLQQYLANIGLKVNVKLGGINSVVAEPLFRKSKWMMLGGDVSHPSPGQLRMNPPPPSFSALSASWDKDCSAYTSVASAQPGGAEMIADFSAMAKELLNRFGEKNSGQFPDSILYFRDGTSESEFETILAQEAKPLIGNILHLNLFLTEKNHLTFNSRAMQKPSKASKTNCDCLHQAASHKNVPDRARR